MKFIKHVSKLINAKFHIVNSVMLILVSVWNVKVTIA